jgi:adenylate cyclase
MRNPHFCDLCETMIREHRGGAEMDIAVLFADVRGSTPMAARMRPAAFGALMQRFYLAATKVFRETDAVVDKMVGDEVLGLYFPGLTGIDYRRAAAQRRASQLLRATGHGSAEPPWLSIGIGVHTGKAFDASARRRRRFLRVRRPRRHDDCGCSHGKRRQRRRDCPQRRSLAA